MAEAYYQLGNNTKADQIIDELANKSVEYLTWYLSLDDNHLLMSQREFIMHLSALDMEVKMMEKYRPSPGKPYARGSHLHKISLPVSEDLLHRSCHPSVEVPELYVR